MISQLLFNVQESLFPHLETCLGPLSNKEKKLVEILEFSQVDNFFLSDSYTFGRPPSSRMMMARAFVAKAVFNIPRASDLIERLRSHCNHGVKKNSKGFKIKWRGYKLNLVVTDSQIPVSCILTSASVHDSQFAIPLSKMTRERVDHCYELMDAAYDAKEIKEFISLNGQILV